MKSLSLIIASIFAVAVSLLAESFWQEKPYTQWSQKEVDQILKDSPWAAEITVSPEAIFNAMRAAGGRRGGGDDGRARGGFPGRPWRRWWFSAAFYRAPTFPSAVTVAALLHYQV